MSFDSELHEMFKQNQSDMLGIDKVLDAILSGEEFTYEDCDDLSQEELDKVFAPNE